MKSHKALFAGVLLALSFTAHADVTSKASNLVSLSKIDSITSESTKHLAKLALNKGKIDESQYECISSIEDADFTKTFSEIIQNGMDESEIDQALEFFQSPSGIKYTKHGLNQFYIMTGTKPVEEVPVFTNEEKSVLGSFLRTSAGNKLLLQRLTGAPIAQEKIISILKNKNCGINLPL